jgi:hypothetical protein
MGQPAHWHRGSRSISRPPITRLIFLDILTIFLKLEYDPASFLQPYRDKTHDAAALRNRAPRPRSGHSRRDARRLLRRDTRRPRRAMSGETRGPLRNGNLRGNPRAPGVAARIRKHAIR